MRNEVIEKAKALIVEINKFKDVRAKIENAEIQLHSAKSENERLNTRLEELLSKHAKQVKDDLHHQILEVTKAYEEILLGIFESQVTGISDTLSEIVSISNEVVGLHEKTLKSMEGSFNQSLSKLEQTTEANNIELQNSRTQLSEILNDIALKIKDSGIQFNATSNVAQTNFKKLLDDFVVKLESQTGEGITKEFVKETMKQILQDGFEAATQQIREVAPIAKKQTDQISQLLESITELKEELKFFKASKIETDQSQIEKEK
jgi:hypothetical protein